jgi:hypothetical protein
MNNIFFTKKGCTEKAKVDRIWPTKYFSTTPREFFRGAGLTDLFVIIDPVLANKSYFLFNITVQSAANLKFDEFGGGHVYASSPTLISAHYEAKRLELASWPCQVGFKVAQQEYWHTLHDALELVREAIVKCDKYFPKQT